MTQEYTLWADHPNRAHVLDNTIAFLNRLPVDKNWSITVKRAVKKRSTLQNNALFGVAYPPICKVTGYDPNDLHEAFCGKYFGWVDAVVMGEPKRRPFRTTTRDYQGKRDVISARIFSEIYTVVQREGAKIGIDVPDPDPFWREKL